jgi:hypothetical protein
MEIEFDEQGLKEMAVVKWRLGPEEWSAKVVPPTRADADVDLIGHTAEVRSGENAGGNEKDTGAQKGPSWRMERVCCCSGGCQIGRSSCCERTHS